MYVVVDHRPGVTEAYASSLANEGVASLGLQPQEFREWFSAASAADVEGMQSVVVGEFEGRASCSELIRKRTQVPILALSEVRNLAATLELFSAGVDDVVRMPVHVREIIARSNAIWRRINRLSEQVKCERMKVFFDGRDVEIDGAPMILPRRERRILEFLVKNAHRRVTKTQIFNAVYGPFEESVDEIVVEGHVSKLRKKLRLRLGRDVIDAKRYLGYQFVGDRSDALAPADEAWPVILRAKAAAAELRDTRSIVTQTTNRDTPIDLPNRFLPPEQLEQAIAAAKRGGSIAVHCLDVDCFKPVNDRFGQASADLLMRTVADRLKTATRDTDTISRSGGDEFILVQSAITRDSDASAFAKRLIAAVSAPYEINDQQVTVGPSVGIALAPRHGTEADLLLSRAAAAANRCKSSNGQGTYSFFD